MQILGMHRPEPATYVMATCGKLVDQSRVRTIHDGKTGLTFQFRRSIRIFLFSRLIFAWGSAGETCSAWECPKCQTAIKRACASLVVREKAREMETNIMLNSHGYVRQICVLLVLSFFSRYLVGDIFPFARSRLNFDPKLAWDQPQLARIRPNSPKSANFDPH